MQMYNSHTIKLHVQSGPITTRIVRGEVYSIQHYVIKFASDLRQVGGFLRVPQFPPPMKLISLYKRFFVELV
jgi:hypothetical protein